jgi:hypothetical protein
MRRSAHNTDMHTHTHAHTHTCTHKHMHTHTHAHMHSPRVPERWKGFRSYFSCARALFVRHPRARTHKHMHIHTLTTHSHTHSLTHHTITHVWHPRARARTHTLAHTQVFFFTHTHRTWRRWNGLQMSTAMWGFWDFCANAKETQMPPSIGGALLHITHKITTHYRALLLPHITTQMYRGHRCYRPLVRLWEREWEGEG